MAVIRTDRIGHFKARDNAGRSYRVIVFQQIIDAGTTIHDNQRAEVPGMKVLRTEDGRDVNKRGRGEYEILDRSRIRITSNDPSAP